MTLEDDADIAAVLRNTAGAHRSQGSQHMDTGKDLAERAARALAASSKTSQTAAGPTEPQDARIDAINQVFALFRLNYHNQYYKAFEDASQLNQAKKLWLEALAGIDIESILRGARRCIEDSEYLPTLHRMLESCNAARRNRCHRTRSLPMRDVLRKYHDSATSNNVDSMITRTAPRWG